MDFEDWNENDPVPDMLVSGLITEERRKAWNAAIHSMGNPQQNESGDLNQLRERCHELYSEKCDLSTRIKEVSSDNAKLLAEIRELRERVHA